MRDGGLLIRDMMSKNRSEQSDGLSGACESENRIPTQDWALSLCERTRPLLSRQYVLKHSLLFNF